MRFIGVRDLRNRSSKIWKELQKEKEIVITSNGKPIAILSSTSERDLEENIATIRQARAIRAVTSMQIRSVELGTNTLTDEEVKDEIKAVRKA